MNPFLQIAQRLGATRLIMMGLVGAVMIGFFVFLVGRVTTPQMGLLYSNLEISDSSAIVAQLEQANIPYEVRGNGSQLFVPANDVERIRVQVAQEGLPAGGSVGYEIFDRSETLGTTNFVQNVNLIRALEGELARTIRSFDNIDAARVHLVLPRRELFTRETRKPSASVVIRTRGGRLVEPNQVRAIQHLVASATDGLSINRISLVDDAGNLLARAQDDNPDGTAGDDTVSEIRLAAEGRLRNSIERLLERTVGRGMVRAEVSVDLNYDRITENEEVFDPDGQVVRSTQTVDENSSNVDRDDAPVTVANNLPQAEAGQDTSGASSTSQNSRTEETTNFEISKSITTRVREHGAVERLTVAVLVDGNRSVDEDGTLNYAPRNEEELQQLEALVRNAVGYDESRGDQVEVVNMRFADVDAPFFEEDSSFLGLSKSDYFKIGEILLFMIIALLVILLVLRPFMARSIAAMQPPLEPVLPGADGGALEGPGAEEPALQAGEEVEEEDPMISLGAVDGQIKASSVRKIGEIIDKHPDQAIAVLRSWIYEE
ncbi:MAG: flagellar basal-body MS-ring/collar protein FliF [Alphaproteobacteria bacterium]|nr:flagellar basal-body MS-ring/collar protein FliF [Alphaproteobacteria bacterium]